MGSPVHLASWVLLGDQVQGRVQAAIQWGLQARSRFFLLLSRLGSAGQLGTGHQSKSTRPPVQSSCFFRSRTSIDADSMGELTYIPIWPADPSRATRGAGPPPRSMTIEYSRTPGRAEGRVEYRIGSYSSAKCTQNLCLLPKLKC